MILLVLFLSFLIGLEREERKSNPERYSFGSVRTFPLIGLIGYVMALLSGNQLIPVALGFAVVGALLVVSYTHKLSTENNSGVTPEISMLGTYLLGALVYHDQLWIATTITVISKFLLVPKSSLEGLTQRVPPEEIFTFTKFLLLTAVILPVLPRTAFTQFQINPFKTWLVVVAVSTVSYGRYLLLKVRGTLPRHGHRDASGDRLFGKQGYLRAGWNYGARRCRSFHPRDCSVGGARRSDHDWGGGHRDCGGE